MKQKRIKADLFPPHFSTVYIIFSVLAAALLISTPFIANETGLYDILFLIYGALITPAFEEMIFRGILWKYLQNKHSVITYITVTVLFALWHIGYVDTIIFRTSILNPDANIAVIMLWKVITGVVFGIILGAVRLKAKNTFPSFLLHSILNSFGS